MRVVAGRLGGLQFNSPKSNNTHPMSEKIRGAIFNMLGDIDGLSILDAFAGSGALSIEAVSRGAVHATAIDSDKNAFETIVKNCQQLKISSQVSAFRSSAYAWLSKNRGRQFDVIFADPPYNDPQYEAIDKLVPALAPGGILIISLPQSTEDARVPGLVQVKQKDYGDARITAFVHK